jgi:hypothetical protein
MRHWISLFENNLYSEVEAASQHTFGAPLHGGEAESWYGTDDPKALVDIIRDDLDNLFASGGRRNLYRILNVPDSVIARLKAGDTLGPHLNPDNPASWTTNWEEIEPTALHIDRYHDDIYNLFVIEAEIPFSAVDIPLTIAQNIHLHWEKEVTLLRNHPIKLVSIHRAEPYGPAGQEMRPDLRGAMMRS